MELKTTAFVIMCNIAAFQLTCYLTFLPFQTTKGASAFKICRGIEAVGGSLRSITKRFIL